MSRKTFSVPVLVTAASLGLAGTEGDADADVITSSSKDGTDSANFGELLKRRPQPAWLAEESLLTPKRLGLRGSPNCRSGNFMPEMLNSGTGKMKMLRIPSLSSTIPPSPAESTPCVSERWFGNESSLGLGTSVVSDSLDSSMEDLESMIETYRTPRRTPSPARSPEPRQRRRQPLVVDVPQVVGPRPSCPSSGTRPGRGHSKTRCESKGFPGTGSEYTFGSLTSGFCTPSRPVTPASEARVARGGAESNEASWPGLIKRPSCRRSESMSSLPSLGSLQPEADDFRESIRKPLADLEPRHDYASLRELLMPPTRHGRRSQDKAQPQHRRPGLAEWGRQMVAW